MPGGVTQQPHEHRTVAESFGLDPDRYDRTRPSYPAALIGRIADDSPGPEVLDVGCGTGIAARQLQATGATVLGVEPDARMAEFARHTGVEVEVATFEAWDAAGRVFDAVYQRVAPDSPFTTTASGRRAVDAYETLYAKAVDGIRQAGGFADPQRQRYDWQRCYSRDEWLDQLPTQGSLTRLPADKLEHVLEGVGAAIDALGGSFTLPYATVAVTAGADRRHLKRS